MSRVSGYRSRRALSRDCTQDATSSTCLALPPTGTDSPPQGSLRLKPSASWAPLPLTQVPYPLRCSAESSLFVDEGGVGFVSKAANSFGLLRFPLAQNSTKVSPSGRSVTLLGGLPS